VSERSTGDRRLALILASTCLLLVAVWAAVPAAGEDLPKSDAKGPLSTATPERVGERASAAMTSISDNLAAYKRYQERMTGASDEDSLVLRLQMEGCRDALIDALRELAAAAPTPAETAGNPELEKRIAVIYSRVTPRIWERVAELRREIDDLRARRTTTPAAQRLVLEDRIARANDRLDIFYKFGIEHLAALTRFGLDAGPDRETYARLLNERADELSGRLDLDLVRMDELKGALKENPGDADSKLTLAANKLALDSDARSQGVTLDLMNQIGLPTEAYRVKLVGITRDLASGILDSRVSATLTREVWLGVKAWSRAHLRHYVVKVVLLILILVAGRLLAGLVRKAVENSLRRAKLNISQLLHRTLVSSAYTAVLVIAVVIALWQLGISLGPMLAGFGVAGFIVGFAMQDSLSNFAAGMMILIYRPYDVGDQVEVVGVFGKVQHMSMVSTSVLTFDNQKLVIPNSKIWGDVIKNVTDQNVRRVDMTFGISYSDDIARAEAVLADILATHARVLPQPEAVVRLHKLGESSVDFVVRPWVKTEDYWDVYWDVTRAVKVRFDAEGISIPFPQRDVHVHATGTPGAAFNG
jgi:small conductance mechanosensitive channel